MNGEMNGVWVGTELVPWPVVRIHIIRRDKIHILRVVIYLQRRDFNFRKRRHALLAFARAQRHPETAVGNHVATA
jgi:hypothetical protein